jgi:twinkle protein
MDMSGSAITAASGAALHQRHSEWIEARGISADLAMKLGLETVQKDGKAWLAVPYVERGQVVNHKYRLISEKRHQMDEGAPLILWNHDCLLEQSDRPVVICEGEWDAITALSLGWRAVSVPNGAPAQASDNPAEAKRYEFLWRARGLLAEVKAFILATDDDEAGRSLRQDLIAMLGADRCSFVDYGKDAKDLNDVLQVYGPEAVSQVLHSAKPVPIQGLYKLSDFPEPAPHAEMALGVPGLSEYLTIVLATLTVFTGWAGRAKPRCSSRSSHRSSGRASE